MNRDGAGLEEAVPHSQAITTAVIACATAVSNRFIRFDTQREVALQELVGHIGKAGPQRVSIGPVARGLAGDPAKANRVQLIPLAIFVVTRVHEVRAVRETGTCQKVRVPLAQKTAQHVKNPPKRVGTTRECRGFTWLQQRSLRNVHFHQIIKAVVKHNLRVKHHDHVDAAEHLEHLFVEIKIDRADRLRVGAFKIKNDFVFVTPH